MRATCKPDRYERAATPFLWKRWKALHHIEQKIDNEIRELAAIKIDTHELEVAVEMLSIIKKDIYRKMKMLRR
jgi:hypothetical protein